MDSVILDRMPSEPAITVSELNRRARTLLEQGIAISQAGQLLDHSAPLQSRGAEAGQPDVWQQYQTRMLNALEQFDEAALDSAYNDALSLYPVELVNSRLVAPLLRLLGQRWKTTAGGVAEEHFFSVYLRNKLGARIHHLNARRKGQLLLVACLPGEQHEVGMLMFALAAVSHGYQVLVLGANLPLEQIPAVLERRRCDAVVLSGSARPARGLFPEQLETLVRPIDRSELYVADEVFLCGTGGQVSAVASIDHRTIGDGRIGPITRQIMDVYFDAVKGKNEAYSDWVVPVY